MLPNNLWPNHWPTLTINNKVAHQNHPCQQLNLILIPDPTQTTLTIEIHVAPHNLEPLVLDLHNLPEPYHIIVNCVAQVKLTLLTTNINTNTKLSLYAQENSQLKHILWECSLAQYVIILHKQAHYTGYIYSINNSALLYNLTLQEPLSTAHIYQLGFCSKQTKAVTQLHIIHNAQQTTSATLCRNISQDTATITHTSKIHVAPAAYNSVAALDVKNLLLNSGACIKASPQLEIYNQDVSCSHANTTGSFDPEVLFYLQSRGLDQTAAKQLLLQSFIANVLRIEHPILATNLYQALGLPEYA